MLALTDLYMGPNKNIDQNGEFQASLEAKPIFFSMLLKA